MLFRSAGGVYRARRNAELYIETDGPVTQGGPITVGTLRLEGSGTYVLDHPENSVRILSGSVGSLAFTHTGSILYIGGPDDADGGEPEGTAGLRATDGDIAVTSRSQPTVYVTAPVSAKGDVRLEGMGYTYLRSDVQAGGRLVFGNTGGMLQQSGSISAHELVVQGPATFTFTQSDNNAVNVLSGSGAHTVNYAQSSQDLTIGTLTSTRLYVAALDRTLRVAGEVYGSEEVQLTAGKIVTGAGSSVSADADNSYVKLTATSSDSDAMQLLGRVDVGAGTVTLDSAGAVTQGEDGGIIASVLHLPNTVAYTFAGANRVGTLAGKVTSLLFRQQGTDLTIGTVAGRSGVESAAGVEIVVEDAALRVEADVKAAGDVVLAGRGITVGALTKIESGAGRVVRMSAGTGGMKLDGEVSSGSGTVVLESGGLVTQASGGAVKTQRLLLVGDGAYALTGSGNAADLLSARAGAITYTQSGRGLATADFQGVSGITATGGDVEVTVVNGALQVSGSSPVAAAGDVTLTADTINVSGGVASTSNGTIRLVATSAGALQLAGAVDAGSGTVVLVSAGEVTQDAGAGITAHELVLDGAGSVTLAGAGNAVDVLSGSAGTLQYAQAAKDLTIGSLAATGGGMQVTAAGRSLAVEGVLFAAGDVTLSAGQVAVMAQGKVESGSGAVRMTAGAGGMQLDGDVASEPGIVVLESGGHVIQGGAGGIRTGRLLLLGNGAFTLTGTSNAAGQLAAQAGAITYNQSAGDLEITVVDGTSGLTAGGDIHVSVADGALTLLESVTAGGDVTLAGRTLSLASERTVASTDNGTVTLTATSAGAGALDLAGGVSAGGGTVVLDSAGAVTQDAGAGITAHELVLRGTGTFMLTGAGNAVDLVSGSAGAVRYEQAAKDVTIGFLTVAAGNVQVSAPDRVLKVSGELSAVGDVTLAAGKIEVTGQGSVAATGDGTVSLAASGSEGMWLDGTISAGAGRVELSSQGLVSQQGGGILAGSLLLQGPATYFLENGSNTVGTLAGDVGAIAYTQTSGDLAIGSVGGTSGIRAAGNVEITAQEGHLTVKAGIETEDDILLAGRKIVMEADGKAASTSNGVVRLTAGPGGMQLDGEITAGGSGTVVLESSGAVTQGDGAVKALGLVLLGTGSYTLSAPGNNVAKLAGRPGAVTYVQAPSLAVDVVAGTSGLVAAGGVVLAVTGAEGELEVAAGLAAQGDITLSARRIAVNQGVSVTSEGDGAAITLAARDGGMSLDGLVAAGAGTVVLETVGAVTQGALGGIAAANLALLGDGTFTLTGEGNQAATLAGEVASLVYGQSDKALTIGTAGGKDGLAASGSVQVTVNGADLQVTQQISADGDVALSAHGITVAAPVLSDGGSLALEAGAGGMELGARLGGDESVLLKSAGAVVQQAGASIVTDTLELVGDDAYALEGDNWVYTLAGFGKAVTFKQANGSLTIGSGTRAQGLTATGGDVRITVDGGGLTVADNISAAGSVALQATSITAAAKVTTAGAKVTLEAAGAMHLYGEVDAGTGTVVLASGSSVNQTGAIKADSLALRGQAVFQLNGSGNHVRALAGEGQWIEYTQAEDLTIGTVDGIHGLTATAAFVKVNVTDGALKIEQAVSANAAVELSAAALELDATITSAARDTVTLKAGAGGMALRGDIDGGTVVLESDGSAEQGADAAIRGGFLLLAGTGDYRLAGAGNAVSTLAGNVGSVHYEQHGSLTIGEVNGVPGLWATDRVLVAAHGADADLTLEEKVSADGAGDYVLVLAAGGKFINRAGATPIYAVNGHYLVFSADHDASDLGEMASPGNLFGRTYSADAVDRIKQEYGLALGSRMVYASRPVITVVIEDRERVYGEANPQFVYTKTGLVPGDRWEDVLKPGTLTTPAGALSPVGSYPITEQADDPFEAFLGYEVEVVNGTLRITPRPITVTADSLSKVYGESDPALTYTITQGNLVGTDTLSGSLTRVAGENAGTYTIEQGTLTDENNPNYTITFIPGALTIERRPIAVEADFLTKELGAPDPELTYRITAGNLVGSDRLNGRLMREPGESLGLYRIDQGTLDHPNYLITFVPGTLAIVPRPGLGDGIPPVNPVSAMGTGLGGGLTTGPGPASGGGPAGVDVATGGGDAGADGGDGGGSAGGDDAGESEEEGEGEQGDTSGE